MTNIHSSKGDNVIMEEIKTEEVDDNDYVRIELYRWGMVGSSEEYPDEDLDEEELERAILDLPIQLLGDVSDEVYLAFENGEWQEMLELLDTSDNKVVVLGYRDMDVDVIICLEKDLEKAKQELMDWMMDGEDPLGLSSDSYYILWKGTDKIVNLLPAKTVSITTSPQLQDELDEFL